MKQLWRTLCSRWKNAMPEFFRIVCWTCALISGTALAINTAIIAGGSAPHEWWNDIYPYLLGIPAGMAFVAKFTQNYDRNGNPIAPVPRDSSRGSLGSVSHYDDSDIIPDTIDMHSVHEIEPYDDGPNA